MTKHVARHGRIVLAALALSGGAALLAAPAQASKEIITEESKTAALADYTRALAPASSGRIAGFSSLVSRTENGKSTPPAVALRVRDADGREVSVLLRLDTALMEVNGKQLAAGDLALDQPVLIWGVWDTPGHLTASHVLVVSTDEEAVE